MIASYIREGVPIIGKLPASGPFEHREVPATKTIKEVLQGTKWSKHVFAATTKPSADDKVDREVLERTMEEVTEGKAKGPYTDKRWTRSWVPPGPRCDG